MLTKVQDIMAWEELAHKEKWKTKDDRFFAYWISQKSHKLCVIIEDGITHLMYTADSFQDARNVCQRILDEEHEKEKRREFKESK